MRQNGSEIEMSHNRSEIETSHNGSEIETSHNGSEIETSQNGSEIETSHNGSETSQTKLFHTFFLEHPHGAQLQESTTIPFCSMLRFTLDYRE